MVTVASLLIGAACHQSRATDYTWVGGTSGSWNQSSNWTGGSGSPRILGDIAHFDLTADTVVNVQYEYASHRIVTGGALLTLDSVGIFTGRTDAICLARIDNNYRVRFANNSYVRLEHSAVGGDAAGPNFFTLNGGEFSTGANWFIAYGNNVVEVAPGTLVNDAGADAGWLEVNLSIGGTVDLQANARFLPPFDPTHDYYFKNPNGVFSTLVASGGTLNVGASSFREGDLFVEAGARVGAADRSATAVFNGGVHLAGAGTATFFSENNTGGGVEFRRPVYTSAFTHSIWLGGAHTSFTGDVEFRNDSGPALDQSIAFTDTVDLVGSDSTTATVTGTAGNSLDVTLGGGGLVLEQGANTLTLDREIPGVTSLGGLVGNGAGASAFLTLTGDLAGVGQIVDYQLTAAAANYHGTITLDPGAGDDTVRLSMADGSWAGSASFAGNGTIQVGDGSGALHLTSSITPGLSTGRIDILGDLVFEDGANVGWEVDGLLDYDRLVVSGDISAMGGWTLELLSPSVPLNGMFTILSAGGLMDPSVLNGITLVNFPKGELFTQGSDLVFFAVVPEPTSVALLAAVAMLAFSRRRR